MTVAGRLSENPDITVLLIEAGQDDRTNPEIYDLYEYSQAFNGPMDWAWTAEQGKTIHGWANFLYAERVHNFIQRTTRRASDGTGQIFSNYMKKSETFSAPNSQQAAKGAQSIASYHGTSGPVQVTYPDAMYGGPQQPAFVNTIVNLTGINHFKDLNGGTPNCVSIPRFTRTNWVTLARHIVTKINWSNPGSVPLTASGVQYAYWTNSSTRYNVYARREVIIAAGAIQEQTMNSLGANSNGQWDKGGNGPSDAIAFPNLYQLFGSQASAKVSQIQSSLATWATSQAGNALSADALQQIYQVQANLIINNNAPVVELFYDTGFPDRGSSTDPFTYPTIKVNYFSVSFDLDVQVAGARLSRRILTSPPLSSLSSGETIPGNLDQEWFASVAHPIGTAAMMKRSLGGVVDAQLIVYDTSNSVRHLSSTLYGVAEKAADLIKAAQ
ncbi:hypothetical protein B0H10DRAFT_2240528 [Mycena sp. CBHHK59/15]|nr:hypothetical protein B0H10DRAFT_2240528 [Mycena sp. CBHHK59/15]